MFKLAQITDLHARWHLPGTPPQIKRRSREMFELLPVALEKLRAAGAEFVALTGDLLDVPYVLIDPTDYFGEDGQPWLATAEADYRALKEILDNCGMPYTVLPGNHDYEPVLWKVFDPEPRWFDVPQGYRLVRFYDREWEGHVPRRVDRERRLMDEVLALSDHTPQIHLQHYLVTPEFHRGYPYSYYEAAELKQRSMDAGKVVLSLAGHYHRGTDLSMAGSCHFATGPAFGEFPHAFRIYTLDEGAVTAETMELADQPIGADRTAVFLDRDGVLCEEHSFGRGPDGMAIYPGAGRQILRLKAAGCMVFVVTNQSNVGRGYIDWLMLARTHDEMCRQLMVDAKDPRGQPDFINAGLGAGDEAVHPDLSDQSRNKPSAEMMCRASEIHGVKAARSWMVGDRQFDIDAAKNFGARPVLVRSGSGRQTESQVRGVEGLTVVDDLEQAVDFILKNEQS